MIGLRLRGGKRFGYRQHGSLLSARDEVLNVVIGSERKLRLDLLDLGNPVRRDWRGRFWLLLQLHRDRIGTTCPFRLVGQLVVGTFAWLKAVRHYIHVEVREGEPRHVILVL